MKKLKSILLLLVASVMLVGCNTKTAELTTFNVQFEEDWVSNWCGDPSKQTNVHQIITDTSVQFRSGRVVSTHGYKNISQITATIDL